MSIWSKTVCDCDLRLGRLAQSGTIKVHVTGNVLFSVLNFSYQTPSQTTAVIFVVDWLDLQMEVVCRLPCCTSNLLTIWPLEWYIRQSESFSISAVDESIQEVLVARACHKVGAGPSEIIQFDDELVGLNYDSIFIC